MGLLKKYVINSENIELKSILRELKDFKNEIKESIIRGERTYLPNASAKELAAYKNPASELSVRAVIAWNILNQDNMIDLPSKVSIVKLNIFKEEDIKDLKDTEPEIYNTIIDKIFNDNTGYFVTKTWDPGVTYVNTKEKEWYKKIPKKYQAKYRKLGPKAWNEFVDDYDFDSPDALNGEWLYNKKGLQAIAIPSNATIPEWLQPYIDYSTMINNILSPFIPVLEIFKARTLEEGRLISGVNRKSNTISNIIKF